MSGLVQEYTFKEKLRNCEPIDLSRFVVDLRERHLEFWTLYSDGCPREHNSKIFTYNRWCALPPKKALATRSPNSLPTHFPILPKDVIHSVARFRLRVHTLCFETATWNPGSSLPEICVRLVMMSRMNSMLFYTAHNPIQCLFAGDMSPYSQRQEHMMF